MNRRRALPFFAAAAVAAASLALPLWSFRMSAPQYPDESLHIRVTARALRGDLQEIGTLQSYIGVRFPTELPELSWLTPAIALFSLLLALAGLAGAGPRGRSFRIAVVTVFFLFLTGSALLLQKRLYDVGHRRDPRAPLQSVRDFTPPVLGAVRVGNFTVWSYPHAGGLALGAAGALGLLGVLGRRRKEPVCACCGPASGTRGAVA